MAGKPKIIICSVNENGCWEWQGTRHKKLGYAKARVRGKPGRVLSRFILEIKLGRPLKNEMDTCHTCDNPPCVNPDHLWEGTRLENIRDKYNKGRAAIREKHGRAKLKNWEVKLIKQFLKEGKLLQREIAMMFNINKSQISLIKRGITWK